VISALPDALEPDGYFDRGGLTFCDPGLLVADTLELPTVQEDGTRHYRRPSLIAREGCIEKVVFPPEKDLDSHTQRVVSWMLAAG
jgi:hypothetical protein